MFEIGIAIGNGQWEPQIRCPLPLFAAAAEGSCCSWFWVQPLPLLPPCTAAAAAAAACCWRSKAMRLANSTKSNLWICDGQAVDRGSLRGWAFDNQRR